MRAELCFFGALCFVFAAVGCNDLFGIGTPQPVQSGGAAGAAGTAGSGAMTVTTNGPGGSGGDAGSGAAPSTGGSDVVSSTTGMSPACGNGLKDNGEECDPKDPFEGARCTSICTVAEVLGLAAGDTHSCALLRGGQVKCWGRNASGQLGLEHPAGLKNIGDEPGEMGASLQPVDLGEGVVATKIVAGANHTCALYGKPGRVKCWGSNSQGQLGLGDNLHRGVDEGQMGDALPPVDLGPNSDVSDIVAGKQHTCALLADFSVKCWGANEHGQAGNVDFDNFGIGDEPNEMGVALSEVDSGILQIAAGAFHTCARYSDGNVRCWGFNLYGQLGAGNTMDLGSAQKAVPVEVYDVCALLWAGGNQTCALNAQEAMVCWGDNAAGQIGQPELDSFGDDETGFPFVKIDSPPAALSSWAMGEQYTCAIFKDIVRCWGANGSGQLGVGTTQPTVGKAPNGVPVTELAMKQPTILAAGASHSCAYDAGVGVKCWGYGQYGQLGIESTVNAGSAAGQMGDALPTVKLVSKDW